MTGCARSLAVLTVLVGLLAGCGIPDRTEVVPQGPGPSTGLSPGDEVVPTRNTRESTTDRAQFVANYLQAAAGEIGGAADRVREFLAPATRRAFKPGPEVRVVRLVEDPLVNPGSATVSLQTQQVGVLKRYGILEPPVTADTTTGYELTVDEVEGLPGLYVTKAPQVLLLSDTALDLFYQRRTIYFWNLDHTSLVPDPRYLSSNVLRERQPTEIINWLTHGPAQWLAGAVEPLPDGTEQIGNVPAIDNGKLQINLSAAAVQLDDPRAVDRLRRQLMWSLRPNLTQILELKIQHQVVGDYPSTDYLSSNRSYHFADQPERFCVYNGQVRRMTQSLNPADPVPAITSEVNRNVRSAALSEVGVRTYAALVVAEGTRQALRVGVAATGQAATFRKVALPAPAGRPVWAVTPEVTDPKGAVGLVVAGGKLYSFGIGTAPPRLVDGQGALAGIASVAVAPDGHRVAVIAGGRLYLSVLTAADNRMQLSPPLPVRTLMRELTAVDWSSEASLVVAGVRTDKDRVAITDVSTDGAEQTYRQLDLGTARITHLVAYPANPVVNSGDANAVAYVADNVAYNVLSQPKRIVAGDVTGPVASPAAGVLPTAPFFLN
jgi:hypothetical protein